MKKICLKTGKIVDAENIEEHILKEGLLELFSQFGPRSVCNGAFGDYEEPYIPFGFKKGERTLVDGVHSHEVVEMTPIEREEALIENIKKMDQAWKAKRDAAGWDWISGPLVWDNAKGGKLKATQAKAWIKNDLIGNYFGRKKALMTGQIQWTDTLLEFPDCPVTPEEVFEEDQP